MIFLMNLLWHPVTPNMERTISFYFWTLIWEGAWSQHWLLSTSLHSVHMLNLQHDLKSTIIRHTQAWCDGEAYMLSWMQVAEVSVWLKRTTTQLSSYMDPLSKLGSAAPQIITRWKIVGFLLKENQMFAERAQRFPSSILPPSISCTVKSWFVGGKMISERRASQWQATCQSFLWSLDLT